MKKVMIINKFATEEVENMIRKAGTMINIEELNLSKNTRNQIEKKIGTDAQTVIEFGRNAAISYDLYPQYAKKWPKYTRELVRALDEAGFIRHDYPIWRVMSLYFAIFTNLSRNYNTSSLAGPSFFLSNEKYEDTPTMTSEELDQTMKALSSLSEREQKVLILRYGFLGGRQRTLRETAEALGVTTERVRQIEAKAIRKMRHPSRSSELPALFGYTPPKKQLPYHLAEDGTKIVDTDADISYLGISVRAYSCLKRGGINTVADVLNYPKEKWSKIRNLGHKTKLEIEDKVREAGYPDFSISLS